MLSIPRGARAAMGVGATVLVLSCAESVAPRSGDSATPRTTVDSASSCTTAGCPSGQTCVAGQCVDALQDGDGDGFTAAVDCDDTDSAVGTTAERPCTATCGAGVERCTMGTWSACDAPSAGTCAVGVTDMETASCGNCGTQSRMRTCSTACEWGTWGSFGACEGEGACAPGAEDLETDSCGNCGNRTRTRTCADDCTWGAWGNFGACAGEGPCTPGQSSSRCPCCRTDKFGACTAGTQCTRTCTASCTWGAESCGSCGSC